MNKTLTVLLFSALALTGCCSRLTQEQLARKLQPDYQRWSKLNENHPQDIQGIHFLQRNLITYGREKKEVWMSPKQALTLGFGDCEEKAFAGAYFAGLLGYPREIIAVVEGIGRPGDTKQPPGHAATLLERTTGNKKVYGFSDANFFIPPVYASVEELIREVNNIRQRQGRDWIFNYYKVIDLDEAFGQTGVTSEKDFWREDIQLGGYTKID